MELKAHSVERHTSISTGDREGYTYREGYNDIEQQIQKSKFLAILIQAMKSIVESRMTDQYRTVINGLLQKNLPIATYEQNLKVAPIWVRKTIWNITKEIE